MREFFPGVLTWPWFSERHGYEFHGTLVLHAGPSLFSINFPLIEGVVLDLRLTDREKEALTEFLKSI